MSELLQTIRAAARAGEAVTFREGIPAHLGLIIEVSRVSVDKATRSTYRTALFDTELEAAYDAEQLVVHSLKLARQQLAAARAVT